MIAYVDSSVLLRVVLGQPRRLKEWGSIETAVGSSLVEVECLRTLDRFRLAQGLADGEVALRRETVYRLAEAMEVVELDRAVLSRASQPLSAELGTLDAIHLASALLWKEQEGRDLVLATHDAALAMAARANGLRVLGS